MENQIPFKAYAGEEPYIFVSYAHVNKGAVFPLIRQLYEKGYRLWYDEGIDPGTEWPDMIEAHLGKAVSMLLFITPQSVASENVKDEIHYAIDEKIPIVPVFLEETELVGGLKLRLRRYQWVHYFTWPNDTAFFGELERSPHLEGCLGESLAPTEAIQQKNARFIFPKKDNLIYICYRKFESEVPYISYNISRIIYNRLVGRGYDVFWDKMFNLPIPEEIRTEYLEACKNAIDQCTDFVVVCSKGSLDRCQDENDWVRKEITQAILQERHIIPVVSRDFKWPKQLPKEMEKLRSFSSFKAPANEFTHSGVDCYGNMMYYLIGELIAKPIR